MRLPKSLFLHYLCRARKKKFPVSFGVFGTPPVLSGEKGKEIKKYLKISVKFALPGVVGSERNFFKKCCRRVGKNFSSPWRETAGRKAIFQRLDFLRCMLVGVMMRSSGTVAKRFDRAVITALPAVNILSVSFVFDSSFCDTKFFTSCSGSNRN